MSTSFPTSIDNYTDPSGSDTLGGSTPTHSQHHANLNDAVEAIEARVGVTGSAVGSSLTKRIANLEVAAPTSGTWTPRLLNFTDFAFCNLGGSASALGKYVRVGDLVTCRFAVTLGTAPSLGTATGPLYLVGPPIAASAFAVASGEVIGTMQAYDAGADEVRLMNVATQDSISWLDLSLLGLPAENALLFYAFTEGIGSGSYTWSPGDPVTLGQAGDSFNGFAHYQAA